MILNPLHQLGLHACVEDSDGNDDDHDNDHDYHDTGSDGNDYATPELSPSSSSALLPGIDSDSDSTLSPLNADSFLASPRLPLTATTVGEAGAIVDAEADKAKKKPKKKRRVFFPSDSDSGNSSIDTEQPLSITGDASTTSNHPLLCGAVFPPGKTSTMTNIECNRDKIARRRDPRMSLNTMMMLM